MTASSVGTLQSRLQQQEQVIEALRWERDTFNLLIAYVDNPTLLTAEIVKFAPRFVQARRAAVFTHEPLDNILLLRGDSDHGHDVPAFSVPANRDSCVGKAFVNRQAVLAGDGHSKKLLVHVPGHDRQPENQLALPMMSGDQTTGVLVLCDRMPSGSAYLKEDEQRAQMLANYAGLLIGKAESRQRERWLADHDVSTRLIRRDRLTEFLPALLANTTGAPGAWAHALIADLDHFKWVNDTLGHQRGNELIAKIGLQIEQVARANCPMLGCQWGGDEFAVCWVSGSEQDGRRMGRLVFQVLQGILATADDLQGKVGVSIGGVTTPRSSATHDLLLKMADEELYKAKEQRNTISVRIQRGAPWQSSGKREAGSATVR